VKIIRNYLPSNSTGLVIFLIPPLILMGMVFFLGLRTEHRNLLGMVMVQDAHAQTISGYDIIQMVN